MSFEPLKRILVQSVKQSPLAPQLQIARVFAAWQQVLARTWGEERAALVSPVSFHEGILKLATTSAAAKQQLGIDLVKLQNETNRQIGDRCVRRIIVQAKGF